MMTKSDGCRRGHDRPGTPWRRVVLGLLAGVSLLGTRVSAQQVFPPANDAFANAQEIIGITGTTSGNNTNATLEAGEPIHGTNAGPHTVWYRWTAPQSGAAIFSTLGTFVSTGVDTFLAAYSGTNLTALTQLTSNDDFDPSILGDSLITFNAILGQPYYVLLTGVDESQGNFVLNWNMPVAVTNVPPPGPNEVQFSATAYDAQESAGFVAITVRYGGGAPGPVTVDYATTDGTAAAGLDYYGVQGTLTFNPGESAQSFVVPIIDNAVQDGNRVFFLQLANLTGGAVFGLYTNATVTIIDDETVSVPSTAGQFQFSTALYQVTEHETSSYLTAIPSRGSPYPRNPRDAAGVLVTVVRTSPNGAPVVGRVMVDYYTTNGPPLTNLPPASTNVNFRRNAVPYRDYVPAQGTLILEDFQMSTNFVIPVLSDTIPNGNAEFNVVLTNPRAYTNATYPELSENPAVIAPGLGRISNAVVSVLEIDGKGYFAFDRISYRQDEDGGTIKVTVVYPLFGPCSVNLRLVRPLTSLMAGSAIAVPDGDFLESAVNVTVVFPSDRNWIELDIPIYDDSLVEFNEDFVLRLDPIPNNPPVHPLARFASATIVFEDQPPGALDREWNPDNVRTTPDQPYNLTPGANGEVKAVVVQPDGKTLLGGDFTRVNTKPRNRIARMNVDGSLDTGFQPIEGANSTVTRVLLYPPASPQAGKILIAGSFTTYNSISRRGIARLNPDGSLDATFSPGNGPRGFGGAPATIWAVVFQPDDRIIVAGDFITFNDVTRYGLARLNANGSLDQTFDPVNGADGVVQALALDDSQPPRIYIGGFFTFYNDTYRSGVARLNSDGSLDTTFDPGTGTFDPDTGAFGGVYALGVQTNGAVLIAGNFTSIDQRSRSGIARLNPDGSLDITFDPGSGVNDSVYTLTLDPQGQALIGGPFTSYNSTRRMGLARLKIDGTLDTTFLDTAYNQFAGMFHHLSIDPVTYVNSIALQADGNIMIGGSFTNLGGNCSSAVRGGYKGFTRDFVRNRLNIARLIGGWGLGTNGAPNPSQGPGNAQFITDNYTVDENGGTLGVTLRRVDGFLGTLAGVFTTGDRLATAGQDYGSVTQFFAFPRTPPWPPDTYYIFVPIYDDPLEEGDETVNLRLSDPVAGGTLNGEFIPLGGALGVSSSALTIADNDKKPGVLTFASVSYATNENARTAYITVIRTNGSYGTVGVQYSTRDGTANAPADYTPILRTPPRTLTFNSGITSQWFTVSLFNDDTVEFDETVFLILTNATGGATLPGGRPTSTDIATLTIVDDDFPQGRLNFASSTFTWAEADGVAVITVTRTGGNSDALSVSYATAPGTATSPADYTNVTGTLSWSDGDTAPRTFSVPLVRDGIVDDPAGLPETVNLVLFNPSVAGALGSRTNATLHITDSDSYGTLSFSQPLYVADENGTNVYITVVRSGGIANTVRVDYLTAPATALPGPTGDYLSASGTLIFGPGELSKVFSVRLIDDTIADGDKTVSLYLTNAVPLVAQGSRSSAILQIVDDESFKVPAGSLDTTFSPDAQADGPVYSLALQPDGRLLVGGAFTKVNQVVRHRIARLKTLGALDPTFDIGSGPDATVNALALQADGRILIGGSFTNVSGTNRSAIARLNSDGTLDRFFSPGAGADNPVYAITLQPDDRILIGGAFASIDGWSRFGVARLNTNGTVDTTFDPRSGANGNVYAVALQADSKVLIGGEFTLVDNVPRNHLARLLPNGHLDTAFAPDVIGSVRAILVQADGRIVVGGSFTNVNGVARNYLARLNADGSLDAAFLGGMAGADSAVFALAQQVDGRILAAGDFTTFNGVTRNRLTRLNPDGSNDPTINFGNGADAFIAAVLVQPDRKIVIGGGFTSYDDQPRRSIARLYGGSIAGVGRLEFTADPYRVFENGTNVIIRVRRIGGTTGDVAADFATTNDTAVAGIDYVATNGTLRFPQGETRQRFVVPVINNTNVYDGDRRLYVGLGNYTGGVTPGPQPLARVLILNDDSLVSFSLAGFSVPENPVSGSATVPVIRSGNTNSALVVTFATGTNGTATPGLDYVATNGTLVFLPGDAVKNFNVPILEDTLIEGNETIELRLTAVTPTNATLLGLATATLTIVDNDFGPGQIYFASTNWSVNEYETNVILTVWRTNGSSGIVSVDYATADVTARVGQDYGFTAGSLTFQNNETLRTINIPIVPDYVAESNETFVVTLSNPSGATLGGSNVATVTILNNDLVHGSLSFVTNRFLATEGDSQISLTVLRSFGALGNISVSYRTADLTASNASDYVGVTNVLSWADGDGAPKTIAVTLLDDAVVEGDEEFRLALFNPVGGASLGFWTNATVTIVNDDFGPGYLGFTSGVFSVPENGTNALLTVTRTFGFTGPVSIDFLTAGGSARPTVDYTPVSGRLDFADGETNKSILIPITDNGLVDGDKTVNVLLLNPQGASTNGQITLAVLTLVDDEPEAGSIDSGFTGPGANGPVNSVVLLTNNGSLLVGGQFTAFNSLPRNYMVRLNPNGSVDPAFDPGTNLNGAVVTIASAPSETKYYIGGYFTNVGGSGLSYLVRLNASGTVDTNFFGGLSGVDNLVAAAVVQPDGKVIIGGQFTSVNGASRYRIARLDATGALDPSFGATTMANGLVRALALQPDGRIVIAGDFDWVNGTYLNRVARLNPDGTLDATFAIGLGADDAVMALALQPDGKILLGGQFLTFDGALTPGVARLHPNGQGDVNFLTGVGADDFVSALTLQPDGKILVGGAFTQFAGVRRNRLTRLHTDGSEDYSINFGAGANSFVAAIVVQPDRRIVIGGGFTEFDGVPRNYLARLNGSDNVGSGSLVFTATNYTVLESGTNVTLAVRRHFGTSNTVQVTFATLDGTARSFAHYLPTNGFLTFPPGESSATVTVPILNDTDTNQNRAFSVVLSDPLSSDPANPPNVGVPGTATVTIVNDDQVLTLSSDAYFVGESGTNAVITVDRLFGSAGTIAVQFRAFDGSATGGADYQPTNGTLVFLDGQTQATFLVPIVNDAAVEGNETVNLLLTNATAPAVVGLARATLSIVDDDFSTGVIGFLQPNFLANEQGTNAVITVVRAGGSAGSASVQFSTADGTATAGQDYRGTNGTLIFADGQIARTIVIPILDDLLVEGDETVNLTLSNPAGGVLGAGTATLTIQADEALFSFSALAYATNEFATNALITVARGDGGTGPASVQYFTSNLTAQAGLDYSSAVGTLTFLPGERSKTFLVPILDDTLGEGDETVLLVLSNAVGEARIVAPSNAVLTLLDNDVSFSFAQPTYAFVEGANALVTVIRTGLLTNTVSVTAASSDGTAINGSDYTFTSAVLVFTNGETAKVVTVPLLDDSIGEAVEYFTVDLSAGPGASVGTPGVTRVEIIDNEDTFSLSTTNYTVDEGATNAEIYISRNGVPSTTGPVTVTLITADGTATGGQDYVGVTNVVTFSLGQTIQRVLVPITEDSLVEGNETFLVRLANPTPNPGPKLVAPTNAVVTILENDIAVAFSAPTYRITESSGAAAIEVRVIGTATNVVTVSYQVTNGTATAASDYAPATGRLTFVPGQTNQVLTVPVFDDLLIEGDETVLLRLYNPSNAILTAPSNSVLTIVDDDSSTIVPAGAALISESLVPANQLIDPGETVTVDFGLRNIGNVDTLNLRATLLPTNGVVAPSSPQIYGVLVGGGATVARQFTFTATGTNGAVIRPTFALVDLGNGNNLGTTNFTIVLGRSGNTFAQPAAIVINDRAPATPYPSTITVSNVAGTVTKVTATLHNLSHEYPGDLDILLVGPGGTNVVLMSDAGNGGFPIANVNLTFDDEAAGGLAASGQIQTGTYRPTNLGVLSDPFDSSNAVPAAPRAPYGTTLTVFNGANPNGSWYLYVMDDIAGQVGNIAGGWSLSIITTDPLAPTPDLSVTLADAPDPVVIGSLLTYTNTVVNHGPGTALDIRLTNTLPAGVTYLGATASSGSISTLSNQVILALGSLPAGAQATLVVTLRPTLEGTLIGSTTARGSQPDLNLDNNIATVRTIVTGQPALLISPKDNRVVLAWPEAASSFILEGTANLVPASWSPVTADRTISDGYIYVTVDPVGPMQFFRLRSP